MSKFNHSDKWRLECKTHRVEIMHTNLHENLSKEYLDLFRMSGAGGHHWTLYVTLFDAHPLFKGCLSNNTAHGLSVVNPHCGFQFFEKYLVNDGVTVLKYGCDYNHYGDEYQTTLGIENFEDTAAYSDALRIFELLKQLKPVDDETQLFE